MPTFEEQQAALRASVPKGTAGAAELESQGFTDVGTQSIDTTQPSPKPETTETQPFTKVPTGAKGPQGEEIFDVFAGTEHIQDPNDPRLKGVNIAQLPIGTAPGGFKSKFQTGFEQANANLKGQLPQGTSGASLVQQYSPAKKNDVASMFIKTDPFMEGLVNTWQQFINPQNQRASLKETYNTMLKESGIQAIDMELIDTKNVIEGTEEDIRTEITKASGFATESQILALTNARNKQLIKNYNTLLDTRNSKERYLQTAIGLEQADRQSADQRFETAFNMLTQIATLKQQMQQNARSQAQWLATNIGFDGLYDATGGDPFAMSLVEESLGLPQGGLLSASEQARLVKRQAEEKRRLELEEIETGIELKKEQIKAAPLERKLKEEQIKTEQAQRAKIVSDTGKISQSIEKINGKDMIVTKDNRGAITKIEPISVQQVNTQKLAQNESTVQQLTGIMTNSYLTRAVGPNALQRFSFLDPLTSGKTNLIADVEQIRSQLNLDTLIKAKEQGATFGQLSDQELRVLSSAASKLGTWAVGERDQFGNLTNVTGYKAKPSKFIEEIQKIQNFAKLDYLLSGGDPASVGVFQAPDGKWVSYNIDGSLQDFTEDLLEKR